jgi:hypothetical protein
VIDRHAEPAGDDPREEDTSRAQLDAADIDVAEHFPGCAHQRENTDRMSDRLRLVHL